jgi:predicted nucleotidyltransferase
MILHRVLNEVFRTRSHVAVLRTLLDTSTGFTGNHVARLAGMHPRSALNALTALEQLGIVHRRRGGRDHLFTLNRDHYITQEALLPLFTVEEKFPETVRLRLATCLQRRVLSAVIFGSAARREESPQSDLDVCCIVRTNGDADTLREALESDAPLLATQSGATLAPVFFTLSEFRSKSRSPFVKEILRDGILIAGKKPEVLLRG